MWGQSTTILCCYNSVLPVIICNKILCTLHYKVYWIVKIKQKLKFAFYICNSYKTARTNDHRVVSVNVGIILSDLGVVGRGVMKTLIMRMMMNMMNIRVSQLW